MTKTQNNVLLVLKYEKLVHKEADHVDAFCLIVHCHLALVTVQSIRTKAHGAWGPNTVSIAHKWCMEVIRGVDCS